MAIKQVQVPKVQSKEEEQQKPLLQITLPTTPDMNPRAPLSVGQHNFCAQKNFKQVADLMLALIKNQKLIGLTVTQLSKEIKKLRKNDKKIIENIGKLVKENEPTKT